eukprot:TRINITY_DN4405_c0_g1_i1.p1 TRINITY_DN4405_c0_g1~~TRINITY_DN4405_c0_g1_i1.p1  ORF type:complete len:208 (-),score=42.75 TRINITY_DN4405_c0_g1_i1:384-1007(-)
MPAARRASVALQALQRGEVAKESGANLLLQQVREVEAEEQAHAEKPLIAIVAHENMTPLMGMFVQNCKDQLQNFRLMGTETTCSILREAGLEPDELKVPSGPLGGDQVLAGMIADGNIKAVFFFRDPLSSHAHVADIEALSRLADVYQVYFCTNYRTSAAVLETLHKKASGQGRTRGSIRIPVEMANLGETVQANHKKLHQQAVTVN